MPDTLEEMRCLADGAGLRYEEVLRLSCCIELWGGTHEAAPACTNIGLLGKPDGPLLAKTLDVGGR